MSNLEFNEEKHEYKLDGLIIPCVSDILEPLSKVEYETVSENVLDNAKKKGTEVHQAIEFYNKYKFANIRDEYKGYFEAYKKWLEEFERDYEITEIESEVRTYNKTLWYSGTVDMIVYVVEKNTGKCFTFLIDTKTTAQLNINYVSVQTSGYKKALESNNYKIDKLFVLHLKKDATHNFVELKDKFNIFLACLTIKNYIEMR
jgi:hypothetical protein